MNLLTFPWLRAALRNNLYPGVFQWIAVAAFFVVVWMALFGPNNAGQNFGMALAWVVWWSLLPLSFLLAGRIWCAICPFAWVTDRVQKAVGVRLPVPSLLRRRGVWIVAALLILVTHAHDTRHLSVDARATAYLLLAVLAAVIFFGAFFERRAFCRYVCFIGGFAGNYSRAGMLELRAEPGRCFDCHTHECYGGTEHTPGCPVFLSPPTVEDSSTCQLCLNCVKNCPQDAIRLSFRRPTAELWHISRPCLPDAILAAIVMGIVLIEQAALLRAWNPLVEATGTFLHIDPYVYYPVVYAVLLAGFAGVPLIGLGIAGIFSGLLRGNLGVKEVTGNFATFGYAIIPLALAGHVAHGLYHLLTQSRTVPLACLAIVGWFPGTTRAAWLSNATVFTIEMAVLAVGAVASLYVCYRLSCTEERHASWAAWLPHSLLLLALLAANLYAVSTMLAEMG
jgi:polyferredoxin